MITVIVYSISIFADIALFSVQHLLHLNSVVVSSGVATSLLIFLIERLYEYFFPREKLEKKAEIHIEELLLIIFIPLGSIIIALRGMNHAFEDYLHKVVVEQFNVLFGETCGLVSEIEIQTQIICTVHDGEIDLLF